MKAGQQDLTICPLCQREIHAESRVSRHHLVPRLKGGTHGETVILHQICHSAIHARFTEAELAQRYFTIRDLRAAPDLQDFLSWIKDKPPAFHARTFKRGGGRGRR